MVNSEMAEKGKTGHRQRLRDRFLAGDAESRSDEMLLELLLTFAIGRKDVMSLAQELIRIFGDLSKVLSASPDDICKVKGIGQSSVALLKVVNFIQSGTFSDETCPPLEDMASIKQLPLFKDPSSDSTSKSPSPNLSNRNRGGTKSIPHMADKLENDRRPPSVHRDVEPALKSKELIIPSKKQSSKSKNIQRKLQVSNGYLLEFNQLARVINFLFEQRGAKRISRKVLREDTGLADRQIAGLVSMGAAMGLIKPSLQILTPVGLIVATHDIFLENQGTLEWCHYKSAGSYRNLIWFEVFNQLLAEESAMTQEEWLGYFQDKLKDQYTEKTIKDHVRKEIRFVIDAYMGRNFNRLELLQQSSDERFYRRRYTRFIPLVLSAMIYDFCATKKSHLFQVGEMAATPGSPAVVFGLDTASFRQQIEELHDRGWLRYETTHNLDQIRLKPEFSALEFLTAHFKNEKL